MRYSIIVLFLLLSREVIASSYEVKTIIWSEKAVMMLSVGDLVATTVQFPEPIEAAELSHHELFSGKRLNDTTYLIKSRASQYKGTFTAIGTSGNVYVFLLKPVLFGSKNSPDVFVKIAHDNDKPSVKQVRKAHLPDYMQDTIIEDREITIGALKILGRKNQSDEDIAPIRVFTDRHWTYFDFGKEAHQQLRPTVYRLVDGVETRVNTHTIGDHHQVMVAHTLGEFVLRHGRKRVCILEHTKGGLDEIY